MNTREAIHHPNFSHARQGTGCWRDQVWVYHRDPESPSGVLAVAAGPSAEVGPILRERGTSPLSPTER